ncbi:MAG: hypothetical protein LBK99_04315 [Opitutaceae bacterium]|nr:hypothetical protein [Opitutaceae bacterium]
MVIIAFDDGRRSEERRRPAAGWTVTLPVGHCLLSGSGCRVANGYTGAQRL